MEVKKIYTYHNRIGGNLAESQIASSQADQLLDHKHLQKQKKKKKKIKLNETPR